MDLRVLIAPWRLVGADRPRESLTAAVVVVGVVSLATVGTFLAAGSILAGTIDGPVPVENPDRPAEWVCEDETMPTTFESDVWNCEEPATIERDPQSVINEALGPYLAVGLLGPVILWVLGTVVLFAGGRLAAGDPSLGGTAALAGWAGAGELPRLAVGLGAIWWVLRDVTVSPSSPDAAMATYRTAFESIGPALTVVGLAVIAWQWVMLSDGLADEAGVSRSAAAVTTAVPLGLVAVLALLP